MKQQQRAYSITEGVIWKNLLFYFFPLLFGAFFQQLYNTADAIVVGRFVGKEALSAVGGTTGTLINLLVGFFIGISAGATVTISQYYGAKNEARVEKSVHTALALAIAAGAIIMAGGIVLSSEALRLMGTPEDILPHALTYIRIYFLGIIVNLVYNIGAGILRAVGDSKRPLYFLIAGCFLNIVLDLLFVAVFHLGVAGAAVATLLSQLLSMVLVCRTLMKTKECYQLNIRKLRFEKPIFFRMVKIGLPAGFQSLMYNVTNVTVQSKINGFGTDIIAAWTAYGKIDGIFWMTISSFGIAAATFAGQNFGAGNYVRVRKGVKTCLLMAMTTTIIISTALYFGGNYVLRLFCSDESVLERGMYILRFLAPLYFAYVSIEILSSSLRGMGSTLIPMLLTFLGVCVLRLTWIFTAVPVWRSIKTVIVSYPLAWVTTTVLFIIYYFYYVRKHRI